MAITKHNIAFSSVTQGDYVVAAISRRQVRRFPMAIVGCVVVRGGRISISSVGRMRRLLRKHDFIRAVKNADDFERYPTVAAAAIETRSYPWNGFRFLFIYRVAVRISGFTVVAIQVERAAEQIG